MRRADTVGRLAGDEFVLICDVADDPAALALAERVAVTPSHPFAVQDGQVHVGASVGLTLPVAGQTDPEQVLREADTAMYVAKAQVGSAAVLHDRAMVARGAARPVDEGPTALNLAEDRPIPR